MIRGWIERTGHGLALVITLACGSLLGIIAADTRQPDDLREALHIERREHAKTIEALDIYRTRYRTVADRLCEHIRAHTILIPEECQR